MIRKSVLSAIAGMLLLAGGAMPASGQTCADVYAMMMRAYETGSPRYLDIRAQYDARCASAQPACEELRAACYERGRCRRFRQICGG
jgi:hypothetical protein